MTEMSQELDRKLRLIQRDHPIALSILSVAHEVPLEELDLENLATDWLASKGEPIPRTESAEYRKTLHLVRELFKLMKAQKLGEYIFGRHKRKSRFRWIEGMTTGNIRERARVLCKDASPTLMAELPSESKEYAPKFSREIRNWTFPIRYQVDATLSLPADLTADEAERLASFVKSLVIIK